MYREIENLYIILKVWTC